MQEDHFFMEPGYNSKDTDNQFHKGNDKDNVVGIDHQQGRTDIELPSQVPAEEGYPLHPVMVSHRYSLVNHKILE